MTKSVPEKHRKKIAQQNSKMPKAMKDVMSPTRRCQTELIAAEMERLDHIIWKLPPLRGKK